MSYEDLKEVRKNCAEKENARATAGKGKRSHKRKHTEVKSEKGPNLEAGLAAQKQKGKATPLSEPAKMPKLVRVLELWRALVARIY